MTSIDSIKAVVSQHNGWQPKNRYKIIMPNIYIGNDIVGLDVACRSVSFPGKVINTFGFRTNQKEYKVPNGYSTSEVSMTFTETNDNIVGRYIDAWQAQIVNPYDYIVEYRDLYARNVFILKMNQQDKVTYACLLKKAYPVNKLPVDLSDNQMDTVNEQVVTFEYEDYEIVDHSLTGLVNQIIARTRINILGVPLSNAISIGRAITEIF